MGNRNLVKHHGNRGLYAAVPAELARDGSLSHHARSVALYVWSHDVTFRQSASAVAEALHMGRNTVVDALAELQEHRWLVREIHFKLTEKGNCVWSREVWHLQVGNTPFTPDQVSNLLSARAGLDDDLLSTGAPPALRQSKSPAPSRAP